jgi:hypothetical protein
LKESVECSDVNKASDIKSKAKSKDLTLKTEVKAIDVNINEAFDAKVK